MGKILGESFHTYVAEQINIRQKAHGSGTNGSTRRAEDLTYLNSKTAWIKLASGISIDNRNWEKEKPYQWNRVAKEKILPGYAWTTLAKHNVLFGGTSRLNSTDKILQQRGTSTDANNIWDYYKGAYNVSATRKDNLTTGDFGLLPMPGITSAEIKCLNRGSIKRATVNIKCYGADQFQIMDLLYLRIGYTMFIEWGWSLYLDNKGELVHDYATLIEAENGFFSDKVSTHREMLKKINSYRKAKDGNYDGLLCKVVNFSWTFGEDGSYDIVLELLSLGDIIESLKINIPISVDLNNKLSNIYALYQGNEDEDKQLSPTPINNAISSYLFLQKLYLDSENNPATGIPKDQILDYRECDCPCFINNERIRLPGWFIKPSGEDDFLGTGLEESPLFWGFSESEEQAFIKKYLQGFTEIPFKISDLVLAPTTTSIPPKHYKIIHDIENSYIVYNNKFKLKNQTNQGAKDVVFINYNNSKGDEDYINDQGFYMRLGHLFEYINNNIIPKTQKQNSTSEATEKIIELDYSQWGNFMYVFPYQVSLDPRVCIVNGGEDVSKKQFFPKLIPWKNTEKGYGWTMNIYVNHMQIQSCMDDNLDEDGNLSLFPFLQSLCNNINVALGGVNNLEPIIDEETNTIYIIDANYNESIDRKEYGLELYGYNPAFKSSTFVRDFTIKTDITNDFATMASIGSTAGGYVKGIENTMFSKWNKGLIDRFKEKIVPGNKNSISTKDTKDEPLEIYKKEFWGGYYIPFGVIMLDVVDDTRLYGTLNDSLGLNDQIIEKNIATVTEFYKYCQAEIHRLQPNYSSPTNGFIPINLSVTLDGISGIKIYNSVNVNTSFLPKNYPDSLQFIVKGVNHTIKDNDWETNIETISISQNEIQ